jgi:hypothetical protein
MPRAQSRTDFGGAVGRVLFAEATKIQLHAGLSKMKVAIRNGDLVETDARQQGVNRRLTGWTGTREIPGKAQNAGGDIECTVAFGEASLGVIDQGLRFVIDADAGSACRGSVD